jgi:hypothetical protein
LVRGFNRRDDIFSTHFEDKFQRTAKAATSAKVKPRNGIVLRELDFLGALGDLGGSPTFFV